MSSLPGFIKKNALFCLPVTNKRTLYNMDWQWLNQPHSVLLNAACWFRIFIEEYMPAMYSHSLWLLPKKCLLDWLCWPKGPGNPLTMPSPLACVWVHRWARLGQAAWRGVTVAMPMGAKVPAGSASVCQGGRVSADSLLVTVPAWIWTNIIVWFNLSYRFFESLIPSDSQYTVPVQYLFKHFVQHIFTRFPLYPSMPRGYVGPQLWTNVFLSE